jgi:hypothetical protein
MPCAASGNNRRVRRRRRRRIEVLAAVFMKGSALC